MSRLMLSAVGMVTCACTTVNVYQSPLTQLSDATQQTRIAVAHLSSEVNQLAAANLAIEAAKKSSRFGDPELQDVVPAAYVQLRDDGLGLIERLAARLLAVVSLDNGEKAAKSVERLAESAREFAEQQNAPELARYAGPVGQLASAVTRLYDAQVREEILQKGVREGVPPARKILAEITLDFDPKSARNITGALAEELNLRKAEAIDSYNKMLLAEEGLNPADRNSPQRFASRYAAILSIIAAHNAVEAIKDDAAAKALESMERALDALETAAGSGFASGDFARAAQEISEFSRRAQLLLNQARTIRDARAKTNS